MNLHPQPGTSREDPGMRAHSIVKAPPVIATAQYVGGLVIAALFVALLSFIFSFLGNIFCAALAGMMLGALRTHRWQSVPVSLMFPLVLFVLLRWMKTELSPRQILVLFLISVSVFWLTYGVAAALCFVERKNRLPTSALPGTPTAPAPSPADDSLTEPAAGAMAAASKPNGWLSLEMLQGSWSREANDHPEFQNLRLSIQKEQLTLVGVDSNGRSRVVGHARLNLCVLGAPQTVKRSDLVDEAGTSSLPSRVPGKLSTADLAPAVPFASAQNV
jgi:hypothetical protein